MGEVLLLQRVEFCLGKFGASGGRRSNTRVNRSKTLGLVRRNPGYGHPLRPEYLVTDAGARAAAVCARLVAAAPEEVVNLRKWSIPALAALDSGRRFSELRANLPGVTARSLALALKDLQAARLVEREVLGGYPPSTLYRPTAAGRRLQSLL
jgi:DNA-binding HxlR family transcriptional regulator